MTSSEQIASIGNTEQTSEAYSEPLRQAMMRQRILAVAASELRGGEFSANVAQLLPRVAQSVEGQWIGLFVRVGDQLIPWQSDDLKNSAKGLRLEAISVHDQGFIGAAVRSLMPVPEMGLPSPASLTEDSLERDCEAASAGDYLQAFRSWGATCLDAIPVVRGSVCVGVLVLASRDKALMAPEEIDFLLVFTALLERAWPTIALPSAHSDNDYPATVQALNPFRDREELLTRLTSQAQVGLVVLDYQRRYLYVNAAYAAIHGRVPVDFIGQRIDEVLGDFYENVRDRVDAAFAGRPVKYEIKVPRPDGTERWLAVTYQRHVDALAGVCVFVVLVDITERKAAEERKDEFLAILSHELRNPLAGIVGGVQVLEMLGGVSAEAQEMYAVIGRQAGLMQRLINDLLDVSRISRGKIQLRMQPVELNQLVQQAVDDQRRIAATSQLRLTVHAPVMPIHCLGDPARLTQVMGNLLQNAIKFTPLGGEIVITLSNCDDMAEITVRDPGVGMTAETLQCVFEPFSQGAVSHGDNNNGQRDGGGLGLGLALVRGLMTLHNGSVEAASAGLGKGSCFTIRIPVSQSEPVLETEAESPARVRACRVLLVDDRRDAILPALTFLKREGHQVATASDAPEAIELVKSFEPEIILCDIGLPSMSGMELVQRIRHLPQGHRVFLAAVTGYGLEDDRRAALEAGFDIHITKPISFATLRNVVEQAVMKAKG